MNIINRPVCINRALCSKSKSDKPNSFKWLHSIPKSPEYQTSLGTCIPAACEQNKEAQTLLGQRLGAEADDCDEDFLAAKVTLQMQSGTAAGGPGLLYQLPRGKAFVLERESDTPGRVYIWVILPASECVCVSISRAEQQNIAGSQGNPKVYEHWGPPLLPCRRKGPLPVGWGLDGNSWTWKW